ncbi:MAG: hypothetical protein KOO63_05525 [Bacteroidales bacterium]|nr:hypothetical protein [Candidatus Latescibacterota bacterium]
MNESHSTPMSNKEDIVDASPKSEDLHEVAIEAYKLIQSRVKAQHHIPEVANILQDEIRTIRHLSRVEQGCMSEEFP